MSPARDAALNTLARTALPGWARAKIPRTFSSVPSDPRDLALADQLTTGVVKNLLLLQHLTAHYSNRRLRDIDPLVQRVITIGLYQLRFLTRIPASAAVDEAVAQVKRLRLGRASGFVNAVLRNATRDPAPPLPSRDADPREHARIVLSHPPDVFDRYVALVGVDDALRLCERDNAEPPTIVRLMPGRAAEDLAGPDVAVEPHEQPGMVVVTGAKVAQFDDWASRGVAQVQDPTAARVVDFCDVRPGQTVLDRCAGLGTKTIQLVERVGPHGLVYAIDPAGPRIDRLAQLVARRVLANVHPIRAAMLADVGDALPATFDRALVDVPCGNSGVLPRRPEARYAQDARSLASLHRLQLDILRDTAPRLTPGGRLVYSTCSVWPAENRLVVDAFLAEHPGFRLADEHATLPDLSGDPTRYRDGGYVAVLTGR